MSGDPQLDGMVRDARRHARFGPDAVCSVCGGAEFLVKGTDPPLCDPCRVEPRAFERDHVAGAANLPLVTVPLRPRTHRRVTELRALLGIDEWPSAEGDPVTACAHLVAGLAIYAIVITEWLWQWRRWQRGGSTGVPPPFPFPL